MPGVCCVEMQPVEHRGRAGALQGAAALRSSVSPVLVSFAGGAPQTRGRSEITDGSGGESQRHN